ncbi:MAG: Protein mraZ [uncultured bacterium]|nr:MAG: Protein mraZ [uncultured bacterium]
MLIGQFQTKLDEKGRCAIPAKFRSKIGKRAVLAKWYEGCLVFVGEDGWIALLEKLTAKSEIFTSPVRDTDRFIMGSAFEIELDSQGRFVVPKLLRDYANLASDITFLGLGERIEIWNSKNWEEKERQVSENAEKLIETLARDTKENGK